MIKICVHPCFLRHLRSLFHAFLIVNCQLLIVNCLASCSTHKEIASYQMEADSLRRLERLTIETRTIPESRATLRIPTAELARLAAVPSDAAYVNRSGQATATVRYVHDTLVVTATCDSLQQLIYRYESELNRFRNGERAEQTKKETRHAASLPIINTFFGLLVGGVIGRVLSRR